MSDGPDRIYAWKTTPSGNQGAWVNDTLPRHDGDEEYLRATPELLTLIEANIAIAKHAEVPFTDAGGKKQFAIWVVQRDKLRDAVDDAAIAYARSQEAP